MYDSQYVLLIGGLAIVAHLVLFALYRVIHPAMLLFAGFVIASPLSTAAALPGVIAIKWGRLYLTLLVVMVGLFCVRARQIGGATIAMIVFAVLYVLASLWSVDPLGGLAFKGLFLLTVLTGVVAVMVARHEGELWQLVRAIVVATGVLALVLLGSAAGGAMGALAAGRLEVLGLNPNRIAETVAPLVVFCFFALLYEPSKLWRFTAYAVALPAAALVLATGSRGGFGEVAAGLVVLMVPLVRRPVLFVTISAFVAVGAMVVLGFVEQQRALQFGQYSLDTRWHVWGRALGQFMERPLIGEGWARRAAGGGYGSSVNMHSIYVQVLVEMGVFGALVLIGCLGWCAREGWRALRYSAGQPGVRAWVYLGAAVWLSALAHGAVEAGTLMGSSTNAACLGVGAALFDWTLGTVRSRSAFGLVSQRAETWGAPGYT